MSTRPPAFLVAALSLGAACAFHTGALAMERSWLHDADDSGIDDRIEQVEALGIAAAHLDFDLTAPARIAVFPGVERIEYGVYIGFDRKTVATDVAALAATGLSGLKRYAYIDYVRARGGYEEIAAASQLAGVARIEAIPMVYATNHWGARVVRARDSRGLTASQSYSLFPSAEDLGLDGTGVTVAILDTGVNDEPDMFIPTYPGHEALAGKFLGGGEFYFGDPLLNTGLDETTNPQDHGAEASSYHATHVAGTAIGSGGQDGFFRGVAPQARLVDCKVLSDAGVGFGSVDGVEWCVHNRNNDWGLEGDDLQYAGIDVLNLSLGGVDASDGTDAGSQMINAAAEAGLIVCIATGNDEAIDHIASPAAADLSIAVGATLHSRTLESTDDLVTSFSNEGPRTDDGDSDHLDEMKPSVVAPGSSTMSSDGDPALTEGGAYKALSGTSMATPHVVGVCALLKQLDPSLDQLGIREILQNAAVHDLGSEKGDRPNDPYGLDPNYDPGCGWGLVDTYAAAKEILYPVSGVQVVRIRPVARASDLEIDVAWWTQREFANGGFRVYRAEDVAGAPGTFELVSGPASIPSVGSAIIEGESNRTPYTFVDADPELELGLTYWYQIAWLDAGGMETAEPPAPVDFGETPVLATANYCIVHNAVDNDLDVRVGVSQARDPNDADWWTTGEGANGADSVAVIEPANDGTATIGYLEHSWSLALRESDGLAPYLPPTGANPWFLSVTEGGYVNRLGRISCWSIFVYDGSGEGGTAYATEEPLPYPTIETQTVTLWIEPQTSALPSLSLYARGESSGVRILLGLESGSAAVAISRSETRSPEGRARLHDGSLLVDADGIDYVDSSALPGVQYYYWVEQELPGGGVVLSGPVSASLRSHRSTARFLGANPTSDGGRIGFSVAAGERAAVPVRLSLFDAQGRTVRDLVDDERAAGSYEAHWDGKGTDGRSVAPGVYFLRYQAGATTTSSKLTVVR